MIKIKVETTIPSGSQYENLKTTYESDNLEDRNKLIELAKEDIFNLNNYKNKPKTLNVPESVEELIVKGIKWKITSKNGVNILTREVKE